MTGTPKKNKQKEDFFFEKKRQKTFVSRLAP